MDGWGFLDCCTTGFGDTSHDTSTTVVKRKRLLRRQPMMDPTQWNVHVNPYHVLELRRDATQSEIVQSYRKLALWHHPGRSNASTEERKRRLLFFEILSACYETLMHQESRRRYDVQLKQMERKKSVSSSLFQKGPKYSQSTSDSSGNIYYRPSLGGSRERRMIECSPSSTSTQNSIVSATSHEMTVQKGSSEEQPETMPGLVDSSSSSSSSHSCSTKSKENGSEKVKRKEKSHVKPASTGCSIVCTPNISATLSTSNLKAPKSLADSSTQASGEEPEMHFSESTVNRLFGGPLAPLHRARNFEPFTDPYVVFEQVFGSPVFSRDRTIKNIYNRALCADKNNALAIKTSWNHHPGWEGSAHKEPDGQTTVYVSSRIVRDRKIIRTETVYLDPETGEAKSEVVVQGEDLNEQRAERSKGMSSWLICHKAGNKDQQGSDTKTPASQKPSSSCPRLRSVYGDAVDEFHFWNSELYTACTGYMGCTA